MATLDGKTRALLGGIDHLSIQQKVSLLEAGTCGCCEVANRYDVIDSKNMRKVLYVEERSTMFERICCAPNHSLLLDVYAVDAQGQHNPADQVLTIERAGCCLQKPCLGCFAFASCCSDKVVVHQGRPEGKVGSISSESVLGVIRQPPNGGGIFTPTLQIMSRDDPEKVEMTLRGPTCFGGCAELCCDTSFKLDENKEDKTMRAKVTKVRPKSLGAAARELFTDSDSYTMEIFDAKVSAEQKVHLIGALLLSDYMFFERDSDACSCNPFNQTCAVNFFNCYCCGCICPCKINCGGGSAQASE